MKKFIFFALFALAIFMTGCAHKAEQPFDGQPLAEPQTPSNYQRVYQDGPSGKLSAELPEGWEYECFGQDAKENEDYGITFWPDGKEGGYLQIYYCESFAVCGTDLVEQQTVVAGQPARVGKYDGRSNFSFVNYGGDYSGVVATTSGTSNDFWQQYGGLVTYVLDSVKLEPSEQS